MESEAWADHEPKVVADSNLDVDPPSQLKAALVGDSISVRSSLGQEAVTTSRCTFGVATSSLGRSWWGVSTCSNISQILLIIGIFISTQKYGVKQLLVPYKHNDTLKIITIKNTIKIKNTKSILQSQIDETDRRTVVHTRHLTLTFILGWDEKQVL